MHDENTRDITGDTKKCRMNESEDPKEAEREITRPRQYAEQQYLHDDVLRVRLVARSSGRERQQEKHEHRCRHPDTMPCHLKMPSRPNRPLGRHSKTAIMATKTAIFP